MAMHQLVYILLDYGKYEEAIQFAEKIVNKYPESQFMWWANAHAYYKNGNYQKAKSSYLTLYDLIIADDQRRYKEAVTQFESWMEQLAKKEEDSLNRDEYRERYIKKFTSQYQKMMGIAFEKGDMELYNELKDNFQAILDMRNQEMDEADDKYQECSKMN